MNNHHFHYTGYREGGSGDSHPVDVGESTYPVSTAIDMRMGPLATAQSTRSCFSPVPPSQRLTDTVIPRHQLVRDGFDYFPLSSPVTGCPFPPQQALPVIPGPGQPTGPCPQPGPYSSVATQQTQGPSNHGAGPNFLSETGDYSWVAALSPLVHAGRPYHTGSPTETKYYSSVNRPSPPSHIGDPGIDQSQGMFTDISTILSTLSHIAVHPNPLIGGDCLCAPVTPPKSPLARTCPILARISPVTDPQYHPFVRLAPWRIHQPITLPLSSQSLSSLRLLREWWPTEARSIRA
jgi:hypothetical protein